MYSLILCGISKTGSASVDVEASPDEVWALISDVTRIGEFSPECQRAEWTEGEGAEVGNKFRGYNKSGDYEWNAECIITAAEPGAEFTYSVPPGFDAATTWSFRIEEIDGGSRITESFDAPLLAMPDVYPGQIEGRCAQLQGAIERTVDNLKRTLES